MGKKRQSQSAAAPRTQQVRHRYEFVLSDTEFARAWFVGWLKLPGRRLRAMIAPFIAAIGVVGMQQASDPGSRTLAAITVGLGAWLAIVPFLRLGTLIARRRRSGVGVRPIVVELGEVGVHVGDGGPRGRHIPWADVRAAGRSATHFWFEVSQGPRAAIPLRAVSDPAALEAYLQSHTTWV